MIGDLLCDKWRILRRLGAGGMATVYEASHRNGKRVAIKILHAELRSSEQARARFLREGYIANRVEHPNVPSVLDDGETPDHDAFLVLELLHGETLECRSRAGTISPQYALHVALAVLDVLSAAHDQGIVHRDVKPSNVFLTTDGSVKLLDFGIARMREATPEYDWVTLSAGTTALGTPAFMSPEQARGRWDEVDARSDIWSVGALLFALLTGRNVHQGQTSNDLMILSATSPAPPVASVRPDLPSDLARVVDRALSFHRELRWPDARAMHAALQALRSLPNLNGSQVVGNAPAPERTAASTTFDQLSTVVEVPRKSLRSGFLSLAAAMVLCSAVVAWQTRRKPGHAVTPAAGTVAPRASERAQGDLPARLVLPPTPIEVPPASTALEQLIVQSPVATDAPRKSRVQTVVKAPPRSGQPLTLVEADRAAVSPPGSPSAAGFPDADDWLERRK